MGIYLANPLFILWGYIKLIHCLYCGDILSQFTVYIVGIYKANPLFVLWDIFS